MGEGMSIQCDLCDRSVLGPPPVPAFVDGVAVVRCTNCGGCGLEEIDVESGLHRFCLVCHGHGWVKV